MDTPLIPAWLVTLFSFSAALVLWSVRPMPRMIRISLIVPILYTGFLFAFFQVSDLVAAERVDFSRVGYLLIFFVFIINGAVIRYEWSKRRWL